MRRYQARQQRKKRQRLLLILPIVVVMIAAAAVMASGATFTASSANPNNTFTAGNLSHSNSKAGSAILTASKMKPGDSVLGSVTITNDGDIAGAFTLSTNSLTETAVGTGGGHLADVLQLKIMDGTTQNLQRAHQVGRHDRAWDLGCRGCAHLRLHGHLSRRRHTGEQFYGRQHLQEGRHVHPVRLAFSSVVRQTWPYNQSQETGRRTKRRPRSGRPAISRPSATRLLTGLVMLLAVCGLSGLIATSGATFTKDSRNPGGLFTGGNLRLINSAGDAYVINTTGLRPGQSITGTVALTNEGDFTAGCTLAASALTDTPSSSHLSGALTLKIEDVTGTAISLWSGNIDSLTSLTLTPLGLSATRSYRFTVTFPLAKASASLQGATTAFTILFTGVAQ